MKAVYQRVTEASVTVEGTQIAAIGHGVLLLVGVCDGDTRQEAQVLAKRWRNCAYSAMRTIR